LHRSTRTFLRSPIRAPVPSSSDALPARVCTSIIVAAELRYGAAKRGSSRLAAQLETVLGALNVLPLGAPADAAYGLIRTRLEQSGKPIGGNDLLIAAQAVALGCTIVTDNVLCREASGKFGQRVSDRPPEPASFRRMCILSAAAKRRSRGRASGDALRGSRSGRGEAARDPVRRRSAMCAAILGWRGRNQMVHRDDLALPGLLPAAPRSGEAEPR